MAIFLGQPVARHFAPIRRRISHLVYDRVLADEYPSTQSRLLWYAVASTLASCHRSVGRKHFTSDMIVGSAMEHLIGCYVFMRTVITGHG